MPNDLLFPILIAVACIVVVATIHLLTRPKPTRGDIGVPDAPTRRRRGRRSPAQIVDRSPLPVEPSPTPMSLHGWHIDHEATVLAFVAEADEIAALRPVDSSDAPPIDPDLDAAIDDALGDAVDAHPSPEMRAELAAFRAAALAMRDAVERTDSAAHDRHRQVYDGYRAAWLERLWQFPVDRERVADARRNPPIVTET